MKTNFNFSQILKVSTSDFNLNIIILKYFSITPHQILFLGLFFKEKLKHINDFNHCVINLIFNNVQSIIIVGNFFPKNFQNTEITQLNVANNK